MGFVINCFTDWSQKTFAAGCSSLKNVFQAKNVKML